MAARAGRRAAGDAVLDDVGAILDASYITVRPGNARPAECHLVPCGR